MKKKNVLKNPWTWAVGATARSSDEFGHTCSGCAKSRSDAIRQCIQNADVSLMKRDNFNACIGLSKNGVFRYEDVTAMLKTHVRVEEAAAYFTATNLGLEHIMWGSRNWTFKGSKRVPKDKPDAIDFRYIRQHVIEALCDGSTEEEAERCWRDEHKSFLAQLRSRAKKKYWVELLRKELGFEVLF